jgi:hypothetical protein
MKNVLKVKLCLLSLWFAVSVRAQDSDRPQDAEGCKDSPLISRFAGSVIHSCETKEFEQADFPLGGNKQKHAEGDYRCWDVGTRDGTSEIQVFRNFQTALKNAGFAIDFADSPGQLVAHQGNTWIFIDNRGKLLLPDNRQGKGDEARGHGGRFVVGRRNQGGLAGGPRCPSRAVDRKGVRTDATGCRQQQERRNGKKPKGGAGSGVVGLEKPCRRGNQRSLKATKMETWRRIHSGRDSPPVS